MTHQLVKNEEDLQRAVSDVGSESFFGTDTETYGTRWNDRMFSLQVATANHVWYFNFHDYGRDDVPVLSRGVVMRALDRLWSDARVVHFIHNAKFDLRRFALEGRHIAGGVHCTQSIERFIYNQHIRYSLDACLQRRGRAKDDAVAAYVKEHKLEASYTDPLSGEEYDCKHYEKVPFEIMFQYGCIDAEEVRRLGMEQRVELERFPFYHNDLELQKVAYEMEEIGMITRQEYAQQGLQHELAAKDEVAERLSALAGEPFRSGPTWLRRIFDTYSVPYRVNPKTGNPIFDKAALDAIDHPIAGLVRQYRRHEKYASTYYSVYARSPVIHAEIKLGGTDTGRFSYASPNLQNVPKEEEPDRNKDPEGWEAWNNIPYFVRGCFAPPEDYCFVMIDFNQQEFRLMLDYAGEMDLIRDINDNGADVHQATADAVGITRKQAKTLNFGLLYGMGVQKLAKSLGVDEYTATMIKAQYFSKLPRVQRLIRDVISTAETRGWVKTWVGRKLHVPPPWKDPESGAVVRFEYVMPNHLIQGGCGDIARLAMPPIAELLRPTKSRMLLQVHDELLFQIHKDELHLVDPIQTIMENTYIPRNGMRMTCGVDHSWVSWCKKDVQSGSPVLPPGKCVRE